MRNFWVLTLLVCIFCVAVVLSVKPVKPVKPDKDDDDVVGEENDWKDFKVKHKKKFSSGEEGKRRGHFKRNRKTILAHNKKFSEGKAKYKLRINKFADWSEAELQKLMGGKLPEGSMESIPVERVRRQTITVPDSLDWRDHGVVTPAQYQGGCGSCWIFAAVGTLESHYAIKYGSLEKLSEQYGVDCVNEPQWPACKGGWHGKVYDHLKATGLGIPELLLYPYVAKTTPCQNASTFSNNYGRVSGYTRLPYGDENELKRVVGTIGPVGILMNAKEIGFVYYDTGVYDATVCDPKAVNHCMVVVGYGTDANGIDYWIIKNSWGKSWGENGFTKFIRNRNNRCGIASYALYPKLL